MLLPRLLLICVLGLSLSSAAQSSGCTDPSACNFDPDAVLDDNSCCVCSPFQLLFGTWQLSTEAAAISIGPTPFSTEWYSSNPFGLEPEQYEGRWSLSDNGAYTYHETSGTIDPFGNLVTYNPEVTTVEYFEEGGELGGLAFEVADMNTSLGTLCGWMGYVNSGPTYDVVELTGSNLTILAEVWNDNCASPIGFITVKFDRSSDQLIPPPGGDYCEVGCMDSMACNFNLNALVENNDVCMYAVNTIVNYSVPNCGECAGTINLYIGDDDAPFYYLGGGDDANYEYDWYTADGTLLPDDGPVLENACHGESYYAIIQSMCDDVTTSPIVVDNVQSLGFGVNNLLNPAACGTDNNFLFSSYLSDIFFGGPTWTMDNTSFYLSTASDTLFNNLDFEECDYAWPCGSITVNPIETTTYTLGMTYTDVCGDVYTADSTFTIEVIPAQIPLEIGANPTSGDTPLTVTFDNQTPSLNDYTFHWNFGDGNTLTDDESFIQHTYNSGGFWDVSLTATELATGCNSTLTHPEMIWSIGDGCPAGCTDPNACNFDPEAECDDGTCAEFDECGECGGTGVLGCTDSGACNYDVLASCDDGTCISPNNWNITGDNIVTAFSSAEYSTASVVDATYDWSVSGGVLDGDNGNPTTTVFWGPEGTGQLCLTVSYGACIGEEVCLDLIITPEAPVAGCTDPNACNYNPDASEDNGSCEYVELQNIEGAVTPSAFASETYTYAGAAESGFDWQIEGGVITEGQGTPSIQAVWSSAGSGSLSVQETTADGCSGDTVTLNIVVLPTAVEETQAVLFEIQPNPTSGIIHISSQEPNATWLLRDATGREIELRSKPETAGLTFDLGHLSTGTYFLSLISNNKVQTRRVLLEY